MQRLLGNQKMETEKVAAKARSATARGQILEAEIKTLRADFETQKGVLGQKSANDDQLIASLKQDMAAKQAEIARVQATGKDKTKASASDASKELRNRIVQVTSPAAPGKRAIGV